MNKNVLAQTQNVQEAKALIKTLQNRPKTEMVGLGLIYGAPGLGKSRFAFKYCIENKDSVYFRLDASMSLKSFLEQLCERLCEYHSIPYIKTKKNVQSMFLDILDIFADFPETLLFIDEIDYAFSRKKLLGIIRDFVDKSLATIVLVGMETAKQSLLKCDAHYFDRCNFFAEFKKLSKDDIIDVTKSLTNLSFDEKVLDYLYKTCIGNIRKLVKAIYALEAIAQKRNLQAITAELLHEK